ncbi:MAG: hypothetical protein SVG88_10455 [Halobacteriales archaeon]|nr:hypothetical protein [Halobacteriales archaeon]
MTTTDERDYATVRLLGRPIRPIRLVYAVGIWLGLAVVAILNATVREVLISPVVGNYWGHVASTGTFIALLAIIAGRYFTRLTDHTVVELLAIGGLWLVLTVVFEFGFGHYVMGASWERLLADYDLLAGRVWVLVLVALATFPVLFGHYLDR